MLFVSVCTVRYHHRDLSACLCVFVHYGRGGTYLFVACLSHSTIDHTSIRDVAPFLLQIDTPPTFGRSLSCFHIVHFFLLVLSPSCFAACGHYPSPPVSIVFSLLSSVPNSSMSHSSVFFISSNTSRSSLYISHFPTTLVLLSIALPHGHIYWGGGIALGFERCVVYSCHGST